jgi:hypothetical protein
VPPCSRTPRLNGIDLSAVSLDGTVQPLVITFREDMIEDFQHAPDPLKTAACETALYCLGELIQSFLQLTPRENAATEGYGYSL